MKRFYLVLLCLLPVFGLKANHWEPDPYLFANSMNVVGVIEINGIEQTSDALELGAFCDAECRGSEMLSYYAGLNRYMVFLTLYGDTGHAFTFQLYDHNAQQELLIDCQQSITFVANDVVGSVVEPYVFSFEGVTCSISVNAEPEIGGTVEGGGNYIEGTTCCIKAIPSADYVFAYWTEFGNIVSTEMEWSFVVDGNRSFVAHFVYYDGLLEQGNAFSVFPNPTHGEALIEGASGGVIRLYDLKGQLLKELPLQAGAIQLDLGLLPEGCYLLQTGKVTKKVVKR